MHTPDRDHPWLRVRDADGHEMDRHYEDPGVLDGTFEVITAYPPNDSPFPRETKYRTDKDGTPPDLLKGADLADALEAAGLTEQAKGLTADDKRALLAEFEASHDEDPTNPSGQE